jgi:transketolase
MLERKSGSLGEAYGRALVDLGGRDPSLVVLDADLSGHAHTGAFAKRFPERFFSIDGMESTMVTIAAGLALGGRTAFASGSAVSMAGQAYNAVRLSACYNRANVKIFATHGGLLVGGDGAPYQMLEDIALMRSLPGLAVVVPGDAPTSRAATFAVASIEGPAYVRLTSASLPIVTDGSFTLGRAARLREGSDLTIVAVGAMLARALDVAEDLHQAGVEARVLDFASIKPADEKALIQAARETGALLTMEEHNVLTGLGSLVASAVSTTHPVPVRQVGVPDLFGESGDPWKLLDHYGLSQKHALDEAWELLKLRGRVS